MQGSSGYARGPWQFGTRQLALMPLDDNHGTLHTPSPSFLFFRAFFLAHEEAIKTTGKGYCISRPSDGMDKEQSEVLQLAKWLSNCSVAASELTDLRANHVSPDTAQCPVRVTKAVCKGRIKAPLPTHAKRTVTPGRRTAFQEARRELCVTQCLVDAGPATKAARSPERRVNASEVPHKCSSAAFCQALRYIKSSM